MLTPYPYLQSSFFPLYANQLSEEQANAIREILHSQSGVAHLIEQLKRCNIQSAELNSAIKDLDVENESSMASLIDSISRQLNIYIPLV